MLNLAEANFNSKLADSVPPKRKPKPIPDVQFFGNWSVSISEKEFLLNFKDDIIEKRVIHKNQNSNTNSKTCGNELDPFLNLCYAKYEWKIEKNQKKMRLLYGYEERPIREEWCDMNFYITAIGDLKIEKNNCGISSYNYKKSK